MWTQHNSITVTSSWCASLYQALSVLLVFLDGTQGESLGARLLRVCNCHTLFTPTILAVWCRQSAVNMIRSENMKPTQLEEKIKDGTLRYMYPNTWMAGVGMIWECTLILCVMLLIYIVLSGWFGTSMWCKLVSKWCPPTRSTPTKPTSARPTPTKSTSHEVNSHPNQLSMRFGVYLLKSNQLGYTQCVHPSSFWAYIFFIKEAVLLQLLPGKITPCFTRYQFTKLSIKICWLYYIIMFVIMYRWLRGSYQEYVRWDACSNLTLIPCSSQRSHCWYSTVLHFECFCLC